MSNKDSKVEGPSFTRNFSAGQGFRQVSIPDETEHGRNAQMQEEFQAQKHIAELRQAKVTGIEKITDASKKRIEILSGIGRIFRTIEIDGHTFILRSLKAKELKDAVLACLAFNRIEGQFETRRHLLARSLISIDGIDIELIVGDNSLESKLEAVEEFDEEILTRLHAEYNLMSEESNKKYGLKTEQDTKEVAEEIKK